MKEQPVISGFRSHLFTQPESLGAVAAVHIVVTVIVCVIPLLRTHIGLVRSLCRVLLLFFGVCGSNRWLLTSLFRSVVTMCIC